MVDDSRTWLLKHGRGLQHAAVHFFAGAVHDAFDVASIDPADWQPWRQPNAGKADIIVAQVDTSGTAPANS